MLELTTAQTRLWRDQSFVPRSPPKASSLGTVDDATDEELAELERVFLRQIYPC